MFTEPFARPVFLEETRRRRRCRSGETWIKNEGLVAVGAGVGGGLGAKQAAADNEQGGHGVLILTGSPKKKLVPPGRSSWTDVVHGLSWIEEPSTKRRDSHACYG